MSQVSGLLLLLGRDSSALWDTLKASASCFSILLSLSCSSMLSCSEGEGIVLVSSSSSSSSSSSKMPFPFTSSGNCACFIFLYNSFLSSCRARQRFSSLWIFSTKHSYSLDLMAFCSQRHQAKVQAQFGCMQFISGTGN